VTVLTMRRVRDQVTGPDIEPMTFKTGTRRASGAAGIFPARRSARRAPAARDARRQKLTKTARATTGEVNSARCSSRLRAAQGREEKGRITSGSEAATAQ
jgi:hypothetical protein